MGASLSVRDGFSSLCLLLLGPVPQTVSRTWPASSLLSRTGMMLARREEKIGLLGEGIAAFNVAFVGVPDHDTLEDLIPRFVLGGVAFEILKQATVREIEKSGGIPLLLQLLEHVEFVNCKSLRDPQSAEWWRRGLCDTLMKLVPRAGGLDLESYPLFRQLMGWKDAQ